VAALPLLPFLFLFLLFLFVLFLPVTQQVTRN
jgi:hypothetical protein